MMSERDSISGIHKRHDPFRIRLWCRKQMLDDIGNTLSELGIEIIEDEMRKRLRHRANVFLDIMAHDTIGDIEVRGWPKRQMRDDHAIRLSAMLMHDNDIRHLIRATGGDELAKHEVPAVEPLRVGKDEAELLGELAEARRRRAGRGDDDSRGPVRAVLVVDIGGRRVVKHVRVRV